MFPDVSLFAADGSNYSYYAVCYQDGDCQPNSSGPVQVFGVGGTSASAPAFAGIMALVNEKYGRQGQADFVLYPLKSQFGAAFHDVTVGTNSVPCSISSTGCIAVSNPLVVGGITEGQIGTGTTPEYNAAAGYNLATGLGSVDASVLLADWGNVTFKTTTTTLTPSSTSFTHGTAITVSGSVTGSTTRATSQVTSRTRAAAGTSRRARRPQKSSSDTDPVFWYPRHRWPVIRYPEITKNTSTPAKPPGSAAGYRW